MKILITTLLLCLATSSVFAAGGNIPKDANLKDIQGFAPNGKFSSVLTVNSTWFDMSDYLAGSITAPADCKIRLSNTTGVKAGTVSEPIYGGTWDTIVVDKETKFWNISGCTSGNLRRAK